MEYREHALTRIDVKRPSINVDVGQPSSNKVQCTTSLNDQKEFLRQHGGRPKIYSPDTLSGFYPKSRLGINSSDILDEEFANFATDREHKELYTLSKQLKHK